MGELICCTRCGRPIREDAQGHYPPWCPLCGTEFKRKPPAPAAAPSPAAPAAEPGATHAAPPASAPGPAVPHFHACALRLLSSAHPLYRIYVTGSDLLVFQ